MNKTELISYIAENNKCSKVEAERAINLFTLGVTNAIGSGNDISLIGFGSFTISEVAARSGINPKTKEPLEIPAYKQVRFKVGSTLKDSANGNKASGKQEATNEASDKSKAKAKIGSKSK